MMSCFASSSEPRSIIEVEDGAPSVLSPWEAIRYRFHDFENIPSRKTEIRLTSPTSVHGVNWRLELYPGGNAKAKNGSMSVFLRCDNVVKRKGKDVVRAQQPVAVRANFDILLLRANGAVKTVARSTKGKRFDRKRPSWGNVNFLSRDRILNGRGLLSEGMGILTIEVRIQIVRRKVRPFVPANPLAKRVLRILDEANDNKGEGEAGGDSRSSADLIFDVSGKKIYAHRAILIISAPVLASFADQRRVRHDNDDESEDESRRRQPIPVIPIPGTKPDVFRHLLRYAYGGEVPDAALNLHARDLVDAADRYDVAGLKLAAESRLADELLSSSSRGGLSSRAETAAESIMYADAKNCALLKEAAVDYFVENPADVRGTASFALVKESSAIMDDLVCALVTARTKDKKKRNRQCVRDGDDNDNGDFGEMRVSVLRRKLDDKGLDVDGSKEMLVDRLVKSYERDESSDDSSSSSPEGDTSSSESESTGD